MHPRTTLPAALALCTLALPRLSRADQPAPSPAPTAPPVTLEALVQRVRELEERDAVRSRAVAALQAELAARAPVTPPAVAPTTPAAAQPEPAPSPHLDVREPPFADADWSWLNGSNYQPASLMRVGPVTPTFAVDSYYAFQFSQPQDHTIFLSTTAPRHNEVGLNLAYMGFELNGIDTRYGGPIGRFEIQYGAVTETNQGQDLTTTRGFYLTQRSLTLLKQAGAGWHFHWLHGVNIELGIFPSYVAVESYVSQENWNYTHPFVSDFTPYYFSGLRVQIYPSQHTKVELWAVNGWQTYGQWNEARSGGYLVNWRPHRRVSLTHTAYFGQEQPNNASSLRAYTDNYLQVLAYDAGNESAAFRRLAFCLVADLGYEHRGAVNTPGLPPSGPMGGASITARAEFGTLFAGTLRGDFFFDQGAALVTQLPLGSPYSLPGNGDPNNRYRWLGGGFTATADFRPSPWLLLRLEYAHREANQPYFSGPGGITGPNGMAPRNEMETTSFTPDLRRSDDRVIVNATLRM